MEVMAEHDQAQERDHQWRQAGERVVADVVEAAQ